MRNVIIIAADTLRARNLGFMGYDRPTSPFLDEFSERCVIFDSAYSPRAKTLPGFTSLFSGKHVINHGVTHNGLEIPKDLHFLVEDFQDAGYLTVGFPAAVTIPKRLGIDRGFDFYYDIRKPTLQVNAVEIVNRVQRFLEGNPRKGEISYSGNAKRLFLFIHFFDPHTPYTPDQSVMTRFVNPNYNGQFDGTDIDLIAAYNNYEVEFSESDLRHAVDLYDAEIRTLDNSLKKLVRLLESTGLMNNSLVIFTADHGENLGEHHYILHGHAYEQGLHIPLLFHFPDDLWGGKHIDTLVELTDVLPTVMNIAGVPVIPDVNGRNLLSLIEGVNSSNTSRKYLIARGGISRNEEKVSYSLFDDTYRLILDLPWSEESLLFNITEDPFETKDIAAENPGIVEKMEAIIAMMVDELTPEDTDDSGAMGKQEMDPETEEMLRSLGYLN